jgi:hypothetical protein
MSITIDLENFVTYINFKYVVWAKATLIIKDSSTLRASSSSGAIINAMVLR